jgi:membrane protein implicated in regulation of membrane protease activity
MRMGRVLGATALTLVLYAPMIVVCAVLAQVFFGMWWVGVLALGLWVVAMLAFGRVARRRGWNGQRWLDALAKGLGGHSGGWHR